MTTKEFPRTATVSFTDEDIKRAKHSIEKLDEIIGKYIDGEWKRMKLKNKHGGSDEQKLHIKKV